MLLVGVAGLCAWLVAHAARLTGNSEDAVVVTGVIFGAIILALRPAWCRVRFWRDLCVAFLVHVCLLAMLVQILRTRAITVGGPFETICAIVEAIAIASVLWRRHVSKAAL